MNYYYYYLVYISAYKELKVESLSLYNFKSDFCCAMLLVPSDSQKCSRISLKYVHTYLLLSNILVFFLQFPRKSPCFVNCVSNTVAQNSIFWAKSCK